MLHGEHEHICAVSAAGMVLVAQPRVFASKYVTLDSRTAQAARRSIDAIRDRHTQIHRAWVCLRYVWRECAHVRSVLVLLLRSYAVVRLWAWVRACGEENDDGVMRE